MRRLGIKIGLLKIISLLIRNIAVPKGILVPGIDTGSRKGAVKTIHDMKRPRSPIISIKSSKVIPSDGISDEIPDSTTENFSSSICSITINYLKRL